MKKLLSLLLLTLSCTALADVYVEGYYRSDGTYVRPHYRSSPNSSTYDNYSTRGNVNPYTGQPGYRSPYEIQGRELPESSSGGPLSRGLWLNKPRPRDRDW